MDNILNRINKIKKTVSKIKKNMPVKKTKSSSDKQSSVENNINNSMPMNVTKTLEEADNAMRNLNPLQIMSFALLILGFSSYFFLSGIMVGDMLSDTIFYIIIGAGILLSSVRAPSKEYMNNTSPFKIILDAITKIGPIFFLLLQITGIVVLLQKNSSTIQSETRPDNYNTKIKIINGGLLIQSILVLLSSIKVNMNFMISLIIGLITVIFMYSLRDDFEKKRVDKYKVI